MPLNKQQVFDKVATHLLTQMKQSLAVSASWPGAGPSECAYRGDNGLMCAVGCLIPDELYHESMEGHTASHVLTAYPKFQNLFEDDSELLSLVGELQAVHDDDVPSTWFDGLVSAAYDHDVSIEVLAKYNH